MTGGCSTLVPLTGSCGQTAALEAAAVQLRITQQVTNTLPHSAASNFLHTHPPTKSTWCHWLDRSGAALQSLQPVCHFLLLRHTLPPQKPLFCISTSERGRLCFALPSYVLAKGDVKQYLIVLELSQEVLQRCRHSRNITQWPLFTLEYDI